MKENKTDKIAPAIGLIIIILLFSYIFFFNTPPPDTIRGHKIGKIVEQDNGDFNFKFVTTENDTFKCIFPTPKYTYYRVLISIEIDNPMKNSKPAILRGKKQDKNTFIVDEISNP